MPYIESKIPNIGFLPTGPNDFGTSDQIIDEIDDELNGERFAYAGTPSDITGHSPDNGQQEISGSEISELKSEYIASDSEAISFNSHHSSSEGLDGLDGVEDMTASHLSTSTVRRKSDDHIV